MCNILILVSPKLQDKSITKYITNEISCGILQDETEIKRYISEINWYDYTQTIREDVLKGLIDIKDITFENMLLKLDTVKMIYDKLVYLLSNGYMILEVIVEESSFEMEVFNYMDDGKDFIKIII